MRASVSIPGVVAGAVLGFIARGALTYSQFFEPMWWFHKGLQPFRGLGFTGMVDEDLRTAHSQEVVYCLTASLLPALLGGVIGAVSGATARVWVGAGVGGLLAGLALLFHRLPEVYRSSVDRWRWWVIDSAPNMAEAVIVGAVVGGVAAFVGRRCGRSAAG